MPLPPTTLKKLHTALRTTAITQLARALRVAVPRAQVYLVGGYVRDLLLGRDSKDIDLVVSHVPARTLETFLRRAGTVNLVGRTFGVFKFTPKRKSVAAIDIALPRREHAQGTGGYRDVAVQSNPNLPIEEDLARRDFTVNALAWDVLEGRLIDPLSGIRDIRQNMIRAVGSPSTRFREDYSRMLRALRFACQLRFVIEPKTRAGITQLISHLNDHRRGERVVPTETIGKELLKSFVADGPCALDLWDRHGAIRALMPELLAMKRCSQPSAYHSEGDVWTHTRLALAVLMGSKFQKEFGGPANAEVVLATLFHDIGKPPTRKRAERIRFDGHDAVGATLARAIAERLRLSSYKEERIDVDTERLAWLVGHHLLLISGDPRTMRATTIERHYLRNPELGQELLALQFADGSATLDPRGRPALREYRAMRARIQTMLGERRRTLPPPILDGHAVMRLLRLKPGPEVGAVLEKLREAQLRGIVKTKKEAATFLSSL